MERRNFLKGVFGGVTAGGILLRTPEPEAFAGALTPEAPLIMTPDDFAGVELGNILFNSEGKPVAVITEITTTVDEVDMTNFGDSWRKYVPGSMRVELRATCRGLTSLKVHGHSVAADGNRMRVYKDRR